MHKDTALYYKYLFHTTRVYKKNINNGKYRNNGVFGVDKKLIRVMDKNQEIYLKWPYAFNESTILIITITVYHYT